MIRNLSSSLDSVDDPGPAASAVPLSGPWSLARVHEHLAAGPLVPLRLACASRRSGPFVVSLWYAWRDGALWCATRGASRAARALWDDPRCGFEVVADAPPYRGVRGHGVAALLPEPGEAVLRALLRRYLGSEDTPLGRRLLRRPVGEVAIRIEPRRLSSFDFTDRMAGEPGAS
jgi:hypothetical protein